MIAIFTTVGAVVCYFLFVYLVGAGVDGAEKVYRSRTRPESKS